MESVRLREFRYQEVELKTSHWENQRRETIEMYLSIPDDDLLHYFQVMAGLPSDAEGLTGWYGKGASTFGQKLGAFAKLYLVTGDTRLREKAERLADEWGKCAGVSDAVIDKNDTYVYEKLLGGFLDMYEFLNYKKAVEHIKRLTESAMRRFKKDIKRDGLQDSALWSNRMIEWYTLPENLYRAYQLTGDSMYREFAEQWDYPYFWDKLRNRDFEIGPRHAYSHVNSLSSAAKAYELTGDASYLEAMEIAYQELTEHHIFATGGYGPAECLFTQQKGYLGDSLKSSWDKTKTAELYRNFSGELVGRNDTWGSCEVSCCAWAVFKFCNYLLKFTGKAIYGEWVEKMLYNGTGAQLPVESSGKVMYYANYFLDGALKTTEDRRLQDNGANFTWQCCTGTFPQDLAEYSNMLYYSSDSGIYISQYLPSKVAFEINGNKIKLENYSMYPEEETLKFIISSEKSSRYALNFRVPHWADGTNEVYINGKKQDMTCTPGEWLTLMREWEDGDRIGIIFPFRLRFEAVDEYNPDIVALCYGPLVLSTDTMTVLVGDVNNPENWICQKEGFLFETKKGHVKGYNTLTRLFKPYYKVPGMEWYYLYNRITAPITNSRWFDERKEEC